MRTLWVRHAKDILSFFLLTATVILFFANLFFPKPKLLVTPDFGKSDSWHFSFATKYVLWEKLHEGRLPVWTDKIGAGFPLLAEGQIGTFFLPNLVIYRLAPDPAVAYNLSLVLTILTIAWGMYFWLRSLKLQEQAALFGALTFTFSALVMLQLPHIALLQGFSLLPLIMLATQRLLDHPSSRAIALLAFAIAQQILAGFPQANFITLLFAACYVVWHARQKGRAESWIGFFMSLVLGIGLSSIQLLPSWEFLGQTAMPRGLPQEIASYFSFPLTHLASFIHPFFLGDPKLGTYPHFASFDGSIFWENTGYIGLVPLIFLLPLVKWKNALVTFFLLSVVISFMLMWGSHSPIYLIYSLPPFNLFRVPSRFLWVFVASLVALSASGLSYLIQHVKTKSARYVIVIFLILVNTAHLYTLWHSYHLLTPAEEWLKKPTLVMTLPKDARVITIGSEQAHNRFFLARGWTDTRPFTELRGALAADSNLVWHVAGYEAYAGRTLRRASLLDSLLATGIHVSDQQASVSAIAKKLLDIASVSDIISLVPIEQTEVPLAEKLVFEYALPYHGFAIYRYGNPSSLPRAYLVSKTKKITTEEDAITSLTDSSFDPGKIALIETDVNLDHSPSSARATIMKATDEEVVIAVHNNPRATLLVLNDTFYPGWKAHIDGVSVNILPANVRFRSVVVPPGDHTVTFIYKPFSLYLGALASAVFLIITALLAVFPASFVPFGIRP